MDKKVILAILLSAAVWIIWFLVFKPGEQEKKPIPVETVKETAGETKKIKQQEKTGSKLKNIIKTDVPVKISKPETGSEESTVQMETKKFKITFSSKGASIKSIKLKERKDEKGNNIESILDSKSFSEKDREELHFPAAKGTLDFPIHFSDNEFLKGNTLDDAIWKQSNGKKGRIRFYTNLILNGNPVQVEKIFTLTEGYNFRLEYRFLNKGKKDINLPDGIIVSPADLLGPSLNFSNTYNRLSGIYSLNGEFEQLNKGGGFFSKSTEAIKKEKGNIDWIGIMSRYLLVIMIPEEFSGTEVLYDNRSDTGFRTGMNIRFNDLKAGGKVTKSFNIYIGEKDKDMLSSVDKKIVDAADVSKWIEPIKYFVMWCLLNINKIIGNLGWSLVIFAFLSKLVFMPLTIKSSESMKKMQALTPKIKELKEKHKSKPDVLQKETMKLYKEHKVNPMGGCFPLLLQMPFFFGLYSALINSIDLWQAPFILWINDLSMPDTVATIQGFNINILPVLMTVSSFLQQKLTTVDSGGQQQKMMTMIMPLVLIFIFWNMPSGLVLYWTLQNVFQILHHEFFIKRKAEKKANK